MQTDKSNIAKSTNNISAWIIFGISILYMISPVDIIPDIPVIGWIDDFFVLLTSTLNLIQKTFKDSALWISQIAKILKWITIGLGIIIVLLVLLLGSFLIALFSN